MPKINLLDSSVYNRIAAGEVVQRPASIVKELLENSIDSGASEITIEILEGGIREIRVIDNGCGISKLDIKNAFLPHATSKVCDVCDLDSITTLGFRGEALASIASVSLVEVISKTDDEEVGVKLSINGGIFGDVEECTRSSTGTTMTVQNVFYNTPARAKFLKKPYQEEAEISSVVQKTIFANPYVSFTYVVDNKLVYKTNGENLLSAITSVYGYNVSQDCLEIKYEKNNTRVLGYVCAPTTTKPNRNYQTIIVNGRFIADYAISSVVSNAFGDRLMKRNFPIFVIEIITPFDDVDVNVHPAKTEVRFKNQSVIFGAIYNAIKETLNEYDTKFSLKNKLDQDLPVEPKKNEESIQTSIFDTLAFQSSTEPTSDDKKVSYKDFLQNFLDDSSANKETVLSESTQDSGLLLSLLERSAKESKVGDTQKIDAVSPDIKSNSDHNYLVLGQLFDCYILLQSGENFIIIDQHAAHERLLYDELLMRSENKNHVIQQMLLPFVATYSAKDFARIMDIKDSLNELGIELEEFGKYTIKISALPLALVGINLSSFFDGFLKDFDTRLDFSFSDLLKEKLALRACKSAIKAGDKLQKEQIDSIIKQILDTNMALQCPHGRPIAINYTKTDIEKLFKRIV